MSLTTILFAQGRGSDPLSFRPERDETQWWGRRDSLVRCVASFLFSFVDENKTLILLFDEDWAQMIMHVEGSATTFIPTERNVIALWKKAALAPGQLISEGGFTCLLDISSSTTSDIPSNSDSKRDILLHLQKECNIDFLREHRINSPANVVLRKANKQMLLKIWSEWKLRTRASTTGGVEAAIDKILSSRDAGTSIVGILHESSDTELPVWSHYEQEENKENHIFLFLGAVRDMKQSESNILRKICDIRAIQLVRFRLSEVPEFTSKICTVVSAHHASKKLVPSLLRMQSRKRRIDPAPKSDVVDRSSLHLVFLHFLDISSGELSLDPLKRDTKLWHLIRSVVTALWRSKIVSKDRETVRSPSSSMIVAFRDDVFVDLQTEELVHMMAESHQAAPSEYQVLKAIKDRVENAPKDQGLVDFLAKLWSSEPRLSAFVQVDSNSSTSLLKRFYDIDEGAACVGPRSVFVVLPISKTEHGAKIKMLKKRARSQGLLVSKTSLTKLTSIDLCATIITMIQHFAYQDRLLPLLDTP